MPGKIVNIGSLMCDVAREMNTPYAASKGGIRQLTKAMAVDWAKYRINVNVLAPGYIRTRLTEPLHTDPAFAERVRSRTPLGRWGEPEDVAGAAVFLSSQGADFVTGHVLYVDGGLTAAF